MLNNDALWYELHELDFKLKKVRKKEAVCCDFCIVLYITTLPYLTTTVPVMAKCIHTYTYTYTN